METKEVEESPRPRSKGGSEKAGKVGVEITESKGGTCNQGYEEEAIMSQDSTESLKQPQVTEASSVRTSDSSVTGGSSLYSRHTRSASKNSYSSRTGGNGNRGRFHSASSQEDDAWSDTKPRPKAGYECKICGKKGGQPDSHWFPLCPYAGVQNGGGDHGSLNRNFQPPKEGYKCKICGKEGGEPDSHWFQQCPKKPAKTTSTILRKKTIWVTCLKAQCSCQCRRPVLF